jgi:hypothetical protein
MLTYFILPKVQIIIGHFDFILGQTSISLIKSIYRKNWDNIYNSKLVYLNSFHHALCLESDYEDD